MPQGTRLVSAESDHLQGRHKALLLAPRGARYQILLSGSQAIRVLSVACACACVCVCECVRVCACVPCAAHWQFRSVGLSRVAVPCRARCADPPRTDDRRSCARSSMRLTATKATPSTASSASKCSIGSIPAWARTRSQRPSHCAPLPCFRSLLAPGPGRGALNRGGGGHESIP